MNDLIRRFDDLDIEQKRNQISIELEIIGELINKTEQAFNIPASLDIKNYESKNHSKLSQDEILTFFYEDIFNIERELITLLTFISNRK